MDYEWIMNGLCGDYAGIIDGLFIHDGVIIPRTIRFLAWVQ